MNGVFGVGCEVVGVGLLDLGVMVWNWILLLGVIFLELSVVEEYLNF